MIPERRLRRLDIVLRYCRSEQIYSKPLTPQQAREYLTEACQELGLDLPPEDQWREFFAPVFALERFEKGQVKRLVQSLLNDIVGLDPYTRMRSQNPGQKKP